jgi:hypothetical protein
LVGNVANEGGIPKHGLSLALLIKHAALVSIVLLKCAAVSLDQSIYLREEDAAQYGIVPPKPRVKYRAH